VRLRSGRWCRSQWRRASDRGGFRREWGRVLASLVGFLGDIDLAEEAAQEAFAIAVDVAVACRVLNVSRSGYYDWLGRPDSTREQENELLLKHIRRIHDDSRRTYGSPRIHAELTLGMGLPVNLKRVARLMRQAGIQGLYRRRRRGCTVRDPDATPHARRSLRILRIVDAPTRWPSLSSSPWMRW
jgi:hypothetical protein